MLKFYVLVTDTRTGTTKTMTAKQSHAPHSLTLHLPNDMTAVKPWGAAWSEAVIIDRHHNPARHLRLAL